MLTAWFNNAGVGDDGTLAEVTEERVRRLVEVNLLGTLWGMRAALDAFGAAGGDVVNIASLSGLGPVPGLSVYAATKAAVVSVTMSVDAEAPKAVRVHALCPDGVQTAMLDAIDPPARWPRGSCTPAAGSSTVDEAAEEAVDLRRRAPGGAELPRWRGALVRGIGAGAVGRQRRLRAARRPQGCAASGRP